MIRLARFLISPIISPADMVLYLVILRFGAEGDWLSALVYFIAIIVVTVALKRIAAWKGGGE
ncbi:hypothetical protein [Agrobacterium tumefaciens]|uniref:hypothetical protein n=1 Tax=Agrobacterium tumefaciens TaxID=358 RepID=UPI0021CF523C|nr:hypothetical protein [Agrobacterium tumefaciens]UXS00800.1 hypothetical protein FY156_04470 [Agrobacterium tumefaciens]